MRELDIEKLRNEFRDIIRDSIAEYQSDHATQVEQIFCAAIRQLEVDLIAGRRCSVAMPLTAGVDYDDSVVGGTTLLPAQLKGVAALFFSKCEAFQPSLEYRRTSGGREGEGTVDGCFNIVLSWVDMYDLWTKISSFRPNTISEAAVERIKPVMIIIQDIISKTSNIVNHLKEKVAVLVRTDSSQSIIVMSFKAGTDFSVPGFEDWERCWLCGTPNIGEWFGPVAEAVWNICKGLDFQPDLEYWTEKGENLLEAETEAAQGFHIIIKCDVKQWASSAEA